MADLAKLVVKLEAETKRLHTDLQKATKTIQGFERRTTNSVRKMKKEFAGMAKGLVGVGTLVSIKKFATGTLQATDAMLKQSRVIGLTSEQYQEFQLIADRAGIAQSQFNSNMTAFVKRVGEAKNGMGPLISGLKNSHQELLNNIKASKSQEEALMLVLRAIESTTSAAEKAAIANAAFSRAGVAMVNMANGAKQARQEMRDLGLVIERLDNQNLEKLNDDWNNLLTSIGNRYKKFFLSIYKFIGKLTSTDFDAVAKVNQDIVKTQKELIKYEEILKKNGYGKVKVENLRKELDLLRKKRKALTAPEFTVPGATSTSTVGGKLTTGTPEQDPKYLAWIEKMEALLRDYNLAVADTKTPLENFIERMGRLDAAARTNLVSLDDVRDVQRKLAVQFGEQAEKAKETYGELSEISRQAARNMQDAFADFLFDPFEDGLDGMLKSFGNTLRRMAAEYASSQIFKAIGGALASSGNPIAAGIGAIFAGGKAMGGPVLSGKSYLVGEEGPELLTMGASSGNITPNDSLGGTIINQNISVTGNGDKTLTEAMARAAQEGAQLVYRDAQRNGPIRRAYGV
jgi:hypothetical protein